MIFTATQTAFLEFASLSFFPQLIFLWNTITTGAAAAGCSLKGTVPAWLVLSASQKREGRVHADVENDFCSLIFEFKFSRSRKTGLG